MEWLLCHKPIIWQAKTCTECQINMRQAWTQTFKFLNLTGRGVWDGRVSTAVGEIVGEKDGGETEWMKGNSRLREWMRKEDRAKLSCSLHLTAWEDPPPLPLTTVLLVLLCDFRLSCLFSTGSGILWYCEMLYILVDNILINSMILFHCHSELRSVGKVHFLHELVQSSVHTF